MKRGHPYLIIIISFLSVILLGALCLVLPQASKSGHSMGFVNALFMSTSSVCVTGLSVMPNSVAVDLTHFGKLVMLVLMEIGGLSIITIAVFFFTILGAKLGIGNKFLLREQLNQSSAKGLIRMVRNIVIMSAIIQLIGTLINWYPMYLYLENTGRGDGPFKAFVFSVFHSAASFNNAGFDIFGNDGMLVFSSTSNIIPKVWIYVLNISTMAMIMLGGIGFIIVNDMWHKRFRWSKFRLHTKITLIVSALLFIGGGVALKLTSNMHWLEAFFTSTTCRTAGFQTYDMANLSKYPVAYIICTLLMFIGASPCSCGGGIKTTTLAIILITVHHFATGKSNKAFKRRIQNDQVTKAYVLFNCGIAVVLIGTVLCSLSQPHVGLGKMIFEVVSAFSTTGLSMGITSSLTAFNKLVLVVMMFFGRIGPLTIIGLLNKNWNNDKPEMVDYIEEGVIIG